MSAPPPSIDAQLLARFVPMSALSEAYLHELCQLAQLLELDTDEDITGSLARVEAVHYLVDGIICFSGGGHPDLIIKASDPGSRFALPVEETAGREARTLVPSRLLRIDRAKISTLLIWAQAAGKPSGSRDAERLQADITALLLQSRLFERIPPSNIERVGELIEPISVKAGETVIRQGDEADYYYIIEHGRCEVLHQSDEHPEPVRLAELGEGQSFGEEGLLTGSARNASVRMLSDGVVMRLSREYFVDLISAPLVQKITHQRAEDLVATGARWVDVRLAEEFERDGLDGAVNIPLNEVRERINELPAGGSYVAYCDSGRRAQAATFLMTQRGRHTSCLRDGIARHRPAVRGGRANDESLPALRNALLEANAQLDQALEQKAQADAARDVEERLRNPSDEEAVARARLEALTARSESASESLRAAMERKRELDARVREVEAQATSRRRTAEAELEHLRAEAEDSLNEERQRLAQHYREASARLQKIEEERREAEERFERERARMERELAEAQARMETEAVHIRETMEKARSKAETRADDIRSGYAQQEQTLRRQTEEVLRLERSRLEQEFAVTIAAQKQARNELDLAEAQRVEAQRESERLRAHTEAQLHERRQREDAERDAELARLLEASDMAKARLEAAQKERDAAMRRRADYSRTFDEQVREANPAKQAQLREELANFESAIASADDALSEAQQAHDDATTAQAIAEETAVAARTRADELRLQLYEEMEEWIGEEEERSKAELESAERYAQELQRIQAQKEARRAAQVEATASMLNDVEHMLSGQDTDEAMSGLMRTHLAAEEKARLVGRARQEAAEQTERARAALTRKQEGQDKQ